MGEHGGETRRSWSQLGLGSNSYLTSYLPAVGPWMRYVTSLSLTCFICGMGVTIPTSQGVGRIAEILYITCLALGSASNWEDLGRVLGGSRDTS